jgi:hypothetical protein
VTSSAPLQCGRRNTSRNKGRGHAHGRDMRRRIDNGSNDPRLDSAVLVALRPSPAARLRLTRLGHTSAPEHEAARGDDGGKINHGSHLLLRVEGGFGPCEPNESRLLGPGRAGNTFFRIDRMRGYPLTGAGPRTAVWDRPRFPVYGLSAGLSRTSVSTSSPYRSSFAAPMPEIATRPATSSGLCSAIATSVASVNTTYGGTFSVRA